MTNSNQTVINGIAIVKDSHCDHNFDLLQIEYVLGQLSGAPTDKVTVRQVQLPAGLGRVPCALHGPIMGQPPVPDSEVGLTHRGQRTWPSRLVDRPVQMVPDVTVIVGPHEGQLVLYTMYGGPQAPREPGDPMIPDAELAEARKFWAEHALAKNPGRTA